MNYRIQYVRIEWKKACILFAKSFVYLALVLAAFSAFAYGSARLIGQESVFAPVKAAVVVPDDQKNLKYILGIAGTLDSVSSVGTLEMTKENKALAMLKKGEVQAIIYLSPDFYNDVTQGKNTPVRILLDRSYGKSTSVFEELIKSGVSILDTAQAAVYAYTDVMFLDSFSMKLSRKEMENLISMDFLKLAIARNTVFEEEILLPLDGMDVSQYYAASALTVFAFFAGLSFLHLYDRKDRLVEKKLKICGIGSIFSAITKLVIETLLLWLCLAVLSLTSLFLKENLPTVSENLTVERVLLLLAPSFLMASFYHAVFTLGMRNGENAHAGMIFLLAGTLLLLLGGCFFPTSFLPGGLQKALAVNPVYLFRSSAGRILFGVENVKNLGVLLGAGVLLAAVGEVPVWKEN